MKIGRLIAVIAFLLFAASFRLTGVREAGASPSDKGIPGYLCAYTTLVAPWGADGMRMLRHGPVEYFAVLFSGWINPLFIITLILLVINPNNRLGGVLRIVVIIMFAACWIVFFNEHLHPRAGYFLWTAAMVVALFAGKLFPASRDAGQTSHH